MYLFPNCILAIVHNTVQAGAFCSARFQISAKKKKWSRHDKSKEHRSLSESVPNGQVGIKRMAKEISDTRIALLAR